MSARRSDASTMSHPPDLGDSDRAALLALARRTIAAALGAQAPAAAEDAPVVAREAGAFVTVHVHGDLRGCIGMPEGGRPLGEVVTHCARSAAFEDPRFPSIRRTDLDGLRIEISVLSPLERLPDPAALEVGRHGLVVERGWHRGLLLPQVAAEHGWSAAQFLGHACLKAGLPGDAWRNGATLWVFEADVFGDA